MNPGAAAPLLSTKVKVFQSSDRTTLVPGLPHGRRKLTLAN